jgi:bacterioferritin (cytochrome b1)
MPAAYKDARCAKLIPFREEIRKELTDEQKAADMYHEWSERFIKLKDTHKAEVVRLIAGQEMLHWLVLDSIIQDITKECGK